MSFEQVTPTENTFISQQAFAAPAEQGPAEASASARRAPWYVSLGLFVLFALVAAAIFIVACPKYATPDDFVQDLFARGAYYGPTGYLMPYTLLGYSLPVGLLYHFLPQVAWYPLTQLGMLVLSYWLVAHLALKAPLARASRAICVGVLLVFEVLTCTYFSYTITAFIGMGAALATLCAKACFEPQSRLGLSHVLAFVLLWFSFSLRIESGLASLLLFSPFMFYLVFRHRTARGFALAGVVLLLCGVSAASGRLAYSIVPGWSSFFERADTARAIADYPQLTLAQAQRAVPEFSQNDLDLLYEFMFTDTQTYSHSTMQELSAQVKSFDAHYALSAMLARKSFTAFIGMFVLFGALFAAWLINRAQLRGPARRFFVLSPWILMVALFASFFLRARLKMHVFLPMLAICCFALIASIFLAQAAHTSQDSPAADKPIEPQAPSKRALPLALATAMLALLVALGSVVELKFVRPNQASLSVEASRNAKAYLQEHPNELILFAHNQGLVTNATCLAFEQWSLPTNVIFSGGYEHMTAAWPHFVDTNNFGTDGIFLQLAENPNMVAVGTPAQAKLLQTYIEEHLVPGSTTQVEATAVAELGKGSGGESYSVWQFRAAPTA